MYVCFPKIKKSISLIFKLQNRKTSAHKTCDFALVNMSYVKSVLFIWPQNHKGDLLFVKQTPFILPWFQVRKTPIKKPLTSYVTMIISLIF